MEKLYKEYKPYGKLFAGGREYLLLAPQPLPADSWQEPNQQVWFVVPSEYLGWNKPQTRLLYSYARMVVAFCPVVEFFDIDPILVLTKDEIEEEVEEDTNELPF